MISTISSADFLRFLADDVAENKTFSHRLDGEILDPLNLLSIFSDKEAIIAAYNVSCKKTGVDKQCVGSTPVFVEMAFIKDPVFTFQPPE